jgi:uncharacterized protein
VIDPGRCVGCGECIVVCPNGAIGVRYSRDIPTFQIKMVEYAYAVLQEKRERVLCINFLTHISPGCDCHAYSDAPIVPDLGMLAGTDPVAVDQASADLINAAPAAGGSRLQEVKEAGPDKFRALYPAVDWELALRHAEKIGLGSRSYELSVL